MPCPESYKSKLIAKYGAEKGDEIFQSLCSWDKEVEEQTLHDQMNRSQASANKPLIKFPAYKFTYVAEPKFEGKDSPIIIRAVVLEPGKNVNNWKVSPEEFESVAKQYKAGRQLRTNHGKDVENVIGKSFDGKVVKGKELETYLGRKVEGISDDDKFVIAEFEANPQEPQVRTNILNGYVETGSIGLDANAYCETCSEPLKIVEDSYQKTCHHLDSGINLKNVEVKEYSYVSEPAYEHSIALPSFSAAITNALKNSSLTYKPQETIPEMSTVSKEEPKISATAKKAEGEGESEASALAKAYAESEYKRGLAEGKLAAMEKFRAEGDDEPDEDDKKKTAKKASVEASVKTDQVAKVTTESKTELSKTDEMMARIFKPTAFGMDSAMKELFKAAAEHPTAPNDIRQKFKGRFD